MSDKNFKCKLCHRSDYTLRCICPSCKGVDSYVELLPCVDPKPVNNSTMSDKPEKTRYQTLGNCAVHGLVLHKNGKDCVKCWSELEKHQLKHEVDKAFTALFLEVPPSIANDVRLKVAALLQHYEDTRADLAKPSEKTQAELQRLFEVVEQVIQNSQPIKHIGIVVKSTAAWQVLINAWQYHKADGMVRISPKTCESDMCELCPPLIDKECGE